MKKSKLIICLIISLILLIGCNNRSPVNKSGETDENDDGGIIDRISYRDARYTYNSTKNVYEAELLSYEVMRYEWGGIVREAPNHLITVKINLVYKGEYLPGEVVQDQLYYCYGADDICLNIGSKYLFMTGIDDEFESNPFYFENSLYQAVRKLDNGDYLISTDHKKYSTYADIIYDMLNLEFVENEYGFCFSEESEKGFFVDGLSLDVIYFLADNVYIGEVIEFESLGKANIIVEGYTNGWGTCAITKVKVKVLSVIKGDYTPGQIVEDIIPIAVVQYPLSVEYNRYYIDLDGLLCFSGDGFFEGYESMLNETAE